MTLPLISWNEVCEGHDITPRQIQDLLENSQAISYAVGFRQSKTALFDWTFFRLDSFGPSYHQSSRFYSFCALRRGGWCEGVLLYSS